MSLSLWGGDVLQSFFLICFGVGAGYTVISFFLSGVISVFDFDTDFDLFGGAVSPFKPSVIAAFVTVFGGVGLLTLKFGMFAALSVSAALGMVIAYAMYRFVIIPLNRAQNTSAVEKQALIGCAAKVTEGIPQGKYGKITYYANGNTYSAPAKSEDGGEIARGAEVKIVYIDKNTYYVSKNLLP
jgi:membrane protein implicated in regulation of membrane protease activity